MPFLPPSHAIVNTGHWNLFGYTKKSSNGHNARTCWHFFPVTIFLAFIKGSSSKAHSECAWLFCHWQCTLFFVWGAVEGDEYWYFQLLIKDGKLFRFFLLLQPSKSNIYLYLISNKSLWVRVRQCTQARFQGRSTNAFLGFSVMIFLSFSLRTYIQPTTLDIRNFCVFALERHLINT